MLNALRLRVLIKPGGVIELCAPELPEGVMADVIVIPEQPPSERALASYIGIGKGAFSSPEEADAFLRQERDAWDS